MFGVPATFVPLVSYSSDSMGKMELSSRKDPACWALRALVADAGKGVLSRRLKIPRWNEPLGQLQWLPLLIATTV